MPLPSGLQSFCRKISWQPYGGPLVCDFVFLLLRLKFSIFTFCHFKYMSWCGSLWVHLVWNPLCFLYLDIWEVFSHNFIKYPLYSFLFSPSGTPKMQMLVHLMLSQKFLKLSSLFTMFYFLLFLLGNFHYSIFQITYMFYITSSLVNSLQCIFFFISVIVFSSAGWFFFYIF